MHSEPLHGKGILLWLMLRLLLWLQGELLLLWLLHEGL